MQNYFPLPHKKLPKKINSVTFMGILQPALSQNGLTKLVVWIFGGQSIVPPLRSSLCQKFLLKMTQINLVSRNQLHNIEFWLELAWLGANLKAKHW